MTKFLQIANKFLFSNQKFMNFETKIDAYKGVHLTPQSSVTDQQFHNTINEIENNITKNQTSSVWIHLEKETIKFTSYLCLQKQYKIHKGLEDKISLYKWCLEKSDLVVPYSMFFVACGGVVIQDNKVLLMSEKQGDRQGQYGVPGGRADFGQDIKKCAERQLLQQMGIKAQFKTVLWIRQLSDYTYGSFDIYYACLMKPLKQSLKNIVKCEHEVATVEWVHLKDIKDFMANRTMGTQLHLANYLHELYLRGYDFQNGKINDYSSFIYQSPRDKKSRFFAEHKLVKID